MINCILGKSKTGKTSHIYNMIEEDLNHDFKVILFVPSQSRAKAEEEYLKLLNKRGVIGVNITTIAEFVELKHFEAMYTGMLLRTTKGEQHPEILPEVLQPNVSIYKKEVKELLKN